MQPPNDDYARGNKTFRQTFKPLNIGRVMFFDENQKIYGLALESKVEKGNLRRLTELADSFGITIRFIQFSMEEAGKPTVNAVAFLDFSRAKATPEEALEILTNSYDFVKSAKIIKPQGKGVVFDDYFFPLVAAGERAVVFRKSVYEALFNGVKEKFGTAGEAMLYYQGFSVGTEISNQYLKIAKSNKIEDLVEVAKAINMTLGWGVVDYVSIDPEKGYAKLRIHRSFECEIGEGKGKPQSQFYRGAIAGIFASFFGKDVEVKEAKCIAIGDPYCEFEVKAR
ncbi:MAG: V4R domain-containing protein [Nitrososphaerota archaeon]|nr:V4R domain-containing protein [Nitrososphaerota archaeon]